MAGELEAWTEAAVSQHPELLRLGYFGSFARGDWGMGSDLEVVAGGVVDSCDGPVSERRSADWDLGKLPVPADLLVYTPGGMGAAATAGRSPYRDSRGDMALFSSAHAKILIIGLGNP